MANILLSVTLACYLAVSSIAAVHAFPSEANRDSSESMTVTTNHAQMSPTTPDCHQQAPDHSPGSVSACDILCAALANVISNDQSVKLLLPNEATEYFFLTKGFHTREPALEPHPPK